MAALIPRNGLLLTNRQTIRSAFAAIQICHYSERPSIIKNPTTASLKRGTGGRSSFSGIVCTVFGNTGFIGSNLIGRLGKIGSQVIIPYRGDYYHVQPLKLAGDLGQILFHPFDLRDEDSIRKCVKYSNVVINCIGRDYETRNFSYNDVHVEGAKRLARISKEMGVQRFIHMSCLKATPNPPSFHIPGGSRCLKSKWAGEQVVKNEFPEAIIIRPSTIYGQDDTFLSTYSSRWRSHLRLIPLWKKGEETEKQPIWIGDVCQGIINILRNPKISGQTYQFVGPRRYKLGDLVDWINKYLRWDAEGYGYARDETQWNVTFWAKVLFSEAVFQSVRYGNMFKEGIEMEHVSDEVVKGVPTLEDLGMDNLTLMEDRLSWELRHLRRDAHYTPEIDEFPAPQNPTPLPLKLVDPSY